MYTGFFFVQCDVIWRSWAKFGVWFIIFWTNINAGFFFVQCDVIWPNSNEFRTLSFMDFDPEFCEDLPLILAKKLRILPYTTKSGPKNLHFQPKYPEFWSKYPEFCQNPEFYPFCTKKKPVDVLPHLAFWYGSGYIWSPIAGSLVTALLRSLYSLYLHPVGGFTRGFVRSVVEFSMEFSRVQILQELLQLSGHVHVLVVGEQVHVPEAVDSNQRQVLLGLA